MSYEKEKRKTVAVYKELLNEYGDDPRSSHWTNTDSQLFRFKKLCEIDDLNGKSILDVGCGIGDLFIYLNNNYKNLSYSGIDINDDAIMFAKEKHKDAEFYVYDLCGENNVQDIDAHDFVFINGVFNNKFLGDTAYLENLVFAAFQKANIGLGFNFISEYALKKDNEMAYHNPLRVYQYCLNNCSQKAVMHHKYERADVSIFIYKE